MPRDVEQLWKLSHVAGGVAEPGPVTYDDRYARHDARQMPRIVIAARADHVDLLLALLRLRGPIDGDTEERVVQLLYVAIVSHADREPGRYESPPVSGTAAWAFLLSHRALFERDGRAAIWIIEGDSQLVYEPHNLIYAYGALDAFEAVLRERGFVETETVDLPDFDHVHHYWDEFAELERSVFDESRWSWTRYPLQDVDDPQ